MEWLYTDVLSWRRTILYLIHCFVCNDRSFFNKVITNAERMMIARDRLVVHRVNMKESLVGKRAEHFDCHFRSIEIVSDQLVADED